jgi:Domain of unknown function (DUF4424)
MALSRERSLIEVEPISAAPFLSHQREGRGRLSSVTSGVRREGRSSRRNRRGFEACQSRFALFLLLMGFLFTPSGLGADIAPLQVSGGTAAAKTNHPTIRMESEEVMIRLKEGSYTVDAVFQFRNSGETTTEWVGFPRGDQSFAPETTDRPDFVQFHAWVDGKSAPFSKEGKRWMARHVRFAGNATTTIRIMYEAHYYRGRYATYLVGTGSGWKDSIGRAAFTVDGSAIGGSDHFSARLAAPRVDKLRTEQAVRIEARDYEPKPQDRLQITRILPRGAFAR